MTPGLNGATTHSLLQKGPEIQQKEPSCEGTPSKARKCILHLFSGPHHREDGFAAGGAPVK